MVRAQALGVIDFSRTRLFDPRWWRRSAMLLDELARQADTEIYRAAIIYQTGLLANSRLTDDSFKTTQKHMQSFFNDLVNNLHTWDKRSLDELEQEAETSLIDTYRAVAGDPDDPEYQATLDFSVQNITTPEPARRAAS